MKLLFSWECSDCWHKFAHIVSLFIMDAFVDLFITLCIVINTIFMAIDHYEMDKKLEETLVTGNYVSLPLPDIHLLCLLVGCVDVTSHTYGLSFGVMPALDIHCVCKTIPWSILLQMPYRWR